MDHLARVAEVIQQKTCYLLSLVSDFPQNVLLLLYPSGVFLAVLPASSSSSCFFFFFVVVVVVVVVFFFFFFFFFFFSTSLQKPTPLPLVSGWP